MISFDGWRPKAAGLSAEAGVDGAGTFRLNSPSGLDKARRFAARRPPSIVHVHDPLLWEFGASIALSCGATTLLTLHVFHHAMNGVRSAKSETMSSAAEKLAVSAADVLHVTTSWLARAVSQTFELANERIRIAPLGVHDSAAAKRSRETPKDGSILYVGRFSDVKGTDVFIEALRRLGTPAGDILVVGGLPHNAKRERRWKDKFNEAAPGRVRFRGWLKADELSACYASACLLVVPSSVETFGQVALEGLIHGVPVLASSCPAFCDWLRPTRAAHFFEAGDASDLAAQMSVLIQDPDRRAVLQRRGSDVALSQYQWKHTFPALAAIYEAI